MNDALPEKIKKSIEQIKLDNTSGSVELAKKSAEILIDLINQDISISQIENATHYLVNAQPNMASIFNLVNNLMFNIENSKNPKKTVSEYCKKYLKNLKSADKKISEKVTKLIKKDAKIITHSYSSTVLDALIYTKKSGKRFSVICTESRPKNEGIIFAKKLGKNDINVKLVVDSAIFSLIPYSDLILFGGDSITDSGLINKIGTKGIAMTAKHYNTLTYALCSSIKFLPKNHSVTLDNLKDPKEITNKKLQNVTPVNYYFDYTPIEYITGVITEKEILKPDDVKRVIKNLNIHKSLRSK